MAAPSPTLAGFQAFITGVMNIKPTDLPPTSPTIQMAFAVALAIVNPALRCSPIPSADAAGVPLSAGGATSTMYDLAVYNLAGSNLLNFAQDQPGRRYFARLRKKLNITGFVSGVVQSSGDEGTNVSLVVQDAAKAFTLANLQQLKDPYGRQYLAIAQSYGPATWGMA
jgi:hypothetical protein